MKSHRQRMREYELEYDDANPTRGGRGDPLGAGGRRAGGGAGARVSGERALPVTGRLVGAVGRSGCAGTCWCAARRAAARPRRCCAWRGRWRRRSDAQVLYLDGKGDRENAERFVGLMADAGRQTRVFPNEPFDGWRGEPHEIKGRLMEIVDYAKEGPAAWYRDVAKAVWAWRASTPQGRRAARRSCWQRLDAGSAEAGARRDARTGGPEEPPGRPGATALRSGVRRDARRARRRAGRGRTRTRRMCCSTA